MKTLFHSFISKIVKCGQPSQQRFIALTKPAKNSPLLGAAMDLTKSNSQLFAENALLRHQLLVVLARMLLAATILS